MGRMGRPSDGEPWPASIDALEEVQNRLADAPMPLWQRTGLETCAPLPSVAGSFVCFRRGESGTGARGDIGWAGAAWLVNGELAATATASAATAADYDPGHLALREGPLHEAVLRRLPQLPELLLVDATGRDHPRRAGLALHLGARLGCVSVGVTNRLLLASGDPPADEAGAVSPFYFDGETVGWWLRVRRGVRPLAVHAGWRTDAATALAIVQSCIGRARTPEPLRAARRLAREARARAAT